MGKFNTLLNLRLKQKDTKKPKMTALAERSTNGNLSSFSGLFRITPLSDKEKDLLTGILKNYQENEKDIHQDLKDLMAITSEVKAITNQAVILHGERIKKAQTILKNYKEGAFTAWLITTYGNRQTPYNFLQYYEFYTSMPGHLHTKLDEMPRQAVYTLASRTGADEKKQELVSNYQGEPKQELLETIRKLFPLDKKDKRLPNITNQSIASLHRLKGVFEHPLFLPSKKQKSELKSLIKTLHSLIDIKEIS